MLLNSFVLVLLFPSCLSIDTIAFNESIADSNVLLSRNGIFALGFFSPGNSKYRYLGIWYHKLPEKTVVWVANRNSPINDSSCILSMNPDGNLALYANHKQEIPLWSTNVSNGGTEGSVAQILDSGNLVLMKNEETVWQSFDYPTDTMLPGLKLGLDKRLGLNRILTSWKSSNDPGTGDWLYKLDISGSPQYVLYKGITRYWRSDPWPWDTETLPGYKAISANNQDEIYYSFLVDDESILTRVVVTFTGFMQRLTWDNSTSQWQESRSEPKYAYGHCGPYSILNANNVDGLECTCLPGYVPKSLKNWYLRDGSAGCVKKRQETKSLCRNGEGFVKVEHVKVPDTSISALLNNNLSGKECQELCLRNCTCQAFANLDIEKKGIGCLTWYGQLIDTVENTGGDDIYIRVDAEELAEYSRKRNGFLRKKGMLVTIVLSAVLAMFCTLVFGYAWMKKNWKIKVNKKGIFSTSMRYEIEESRQSPDLPVFSLRAITAATNNFDPANKLGQGGFGVVYKGQLEEGQEIAVKRLSLNSGQGAAEFENEVLLIAKLQHRNLVKLLGCCIHKEEQMLVYEYLPNKSLDYFIFDQRRLLLDWRKRFDIIVGIARGILYLHYDSRLRIIHRDLKASNVLLDADMKPKISDFGMARIFKGDEVQDKTNRVVGTYGYMAPEYVVFGKFSTKSDVFSFGVILLEIISSKKSSSTYLEGPSTNLIGHVWELWKEGRELEMVDASMKEELSTVGPEVARCIQIGLLCVEENAADRPNMTTVVLMLNGETSLPCPKNPAFVFTAKTSEAINPSLSTTNNHSVNQLTITKFQAR